MDMWKAYNHMIATCNPMEHEMNCSVCYKIFLHGLGEAMEYTNTTNLGMHNGMRFYIRFSENWCEMSTYSTRLFNLRSIGNYLRYLFLMYAIWSRCQVSCVWKSIPFQALAKHAYVLETNTSNQKSPQFPFVFRKIA